MTPHEELQAAHKRLSELRDKTTQGEWYGTLRGIATHGIDASEAGRYVAFLGDYIMTEDAELIVTLHRTIDAQLSMLDLGIAEHTLLSEQWGDEYGEATEVDLLGIVGLARAINGEAS